MAVLNESRTYVLAEMPVRKMANGGESRDIVKGTLVTGESVQVHASMQVAGAVPNPLHTIDHSEFICVMEGTLEFLHGDKAERVGPGGVIFVAYKTLHTVKNVGDGVAKYVVLAIGGDAGK